MGKHQVQRLTKIAQLPPLSSPFDSAIRAFCGETVSLTVCLLKTDSSIRHGMNCP